MIRIALADDHKMFAKGIESILYDEEDFDVLEVFSNGQELMDFLKTRRVDVVITDMNMPVMNGEDVIKSIKEDYPLTKVIVLSMYDEEPIFKMCQKAGADAYVLKDADPDELKYTIREVYENSHVMNFQKAIKQNLEDPVDDLFKMRYELTKREVQILKLIKSGMTNKDMAESLHLSQLTIESHRKKIYSKLKVNSVVELLNKVSDMVI
ncbi:response regulator transcription factor [Belliella sp. DSM 111904]|uniref:Response regulator transcription factor n=1 Tax=Belliella filtrata TaxID=2923435 RepID=A0ABS9UZF3_9BACT|nr:response regulator transcription factor [Belliella filtrata]MCH7409529.1 response regulator transcription factor [Belliella filtrata]